MPPCPSTHKDHNFVPYYPSPSEIEGWPLLASLFRRATTAHRILSAMPESLLCLGIPLLHDSKGELRINPIFVPWIRQETSGV